MLRTLCSTFPFSVCLCWFVTFLLHTHSNDSAKRVLTIFLGTCSVLYLCHAFYFNGGLSLWGESLWVLCSLSVYPLYYVYITHLTCRPMANRYVVVCLTPGIVIAATTLLYPSPEADTARKIVNMIQIILVIYFGYHRLQSFDRELANVYADTEEASTKAIKLLLVAFVATSLFSSVANAVGKQNVAASNWLIAILIPFGCLLYALSFIGYTRRFSQKQFQKDLEEERTSGPADDNVLGQKIDELLTTSFCLTKNLKITDLAQEAGSCRTYVSNYINKRYNCSFSDYVNRVRIEHAKQLLLKDPNIKMNVISEEAGYSCEQAFYRNFKRFAGMTPTQWRENAKK